jgi:tRNA G37 N-methylase Trm5
MEEGDVQRRLDAIADAARSKGRIMKELRSRKVKTYSPKLNFYGFDLQFI